MAKQLLNGLLLAAGISAMFSVHSRGATLPFAENFDNQTELSEGWLAVDVNADGKTWVPTWGKASITDFVTKLDLDDWLFTPALEVEKGKSYLVEFKAERGFQGDNPFLAVSYGAGQSASDMTVEIMPETEQKEYIAQKSIGFIITPDTDGPVYIGFHATGLQTAGINVDDVSVKEATMPAAATDLKITKNGVYGSPDVTVSFRAPEKNASGDPISSLQQIVVTRSGIETRRIDNPAPGELIEFEDNCAFGSGNYQWTVRAYGEDGQEGLEAQSDIMFVGINAPAAPTNVNAVEDGHTGMITVTWDPVITDRDGEPMPAELIDYQVICNGNYLVTTGAESPYVFKACEPDEQAFVLVSVVAKSSYGSGTTPVDSFIAGKAMTEYKESFDNGNPVHKLQVSSDPEKPASWFVFDNAMMAMYTGVADGDSDGTNGCGAFMSQFTGYSGSIEIGKFDLSGLENPAITYSTYFCNTGEGTADSNIMTLSADVFDGNGYTVVDTYDMSEYPTYTGWHKVTVPLSDFKEGEVALKISGMIVNAPYMFLDDIRVINLLERNLRVYEPEVSPTMIPGKTYSINAKVENMGAEDMASCKAELLCDGKVVDSADVPALASGESATVGFSYALTLLHPESVKFTVSIDCDDENAADNVSEAVEVSNALPRHPHVTDLVAVSTEPETVALTWSEPDMEFEPEPVSESFESGNGGDVDYFGDWSFIDGDNADTYIIDDSDPLPGQGGKMAAFVVDCTDHRAPYVARTGTKMMGMMPAGEVATNDWLISPELTGDEQTVSFYARSYDQFGYFNEKFTFMVSAEGKAENDFLPLTAEGGMQAENIVPGAWTEYKFQLPEGSKYFAVHYAPAPSTSLMLMLDDFMFTPASAAEPLLLKGFNVYRDGEIINTDPVEELNYIDSNVEAGEHVYNVTALYDRGESRGSNAADVLVASGVYKNICYGVHVYGSKGCLTVVSDSETECIVTGIDGMTVADITVSGKSELSLPDGVYMVRTSKGAVKVLVK